MRNVLIVDDEPVQSKMFAKFISGMDFNVININSGQGAVDFFFNKTAINGITASDVDVVLLDLSMPDVDGISVLKKIEPVKGGIQVIVLTASNEISMAIVAISVGAIDYIVKGEKDVLTRLVTAVNNAVDKKNLKHQVSNLERKNQDKITFTDIIGKSPALVTAVNLAKKVINSTIPILIEGENGTGKEFLARAIHSAGMKSNKPFVVVDVEKLRTDGFDEVFFGTEKHLDDGSVDRVYGKIKEAEGGTLFLDNIHCLKPDAQIKLLRFMQEGEVMPVGGRISSKISVRVISATLVNMESMLRIGKFREDLYYRLSIFPINLPNLVERGPEDVRMLAENFCYAASVSENKKIKGISSDAMEIIVGCHWEDNIRQLKNHIFRAVVLCDGQFLEATHFAHLVKDENISSSKSKRKVRYSVHRNSELVDLFNEDGSCKTMEEITGEVMHRLAEAYDNNLSDVSKYLGVGRSTIYRKLNAYRKINSADENTVEG